MVIEFGYHRITLTNFRCHRISSAAPILGIADSEGNISLHEWIAQEVCRQKVNGTSSCSLTEQCIETVGFSSINILCFFRNSVFILRLVKPAITHRVCTINSAFFLASAENLQFTATWVLWQSPFRTVISACYSQQTVQGCG